MGLAGLRSKYQQGCVPRGGFRGESISLLLLASRRCPHFLVHGPHAILKARSLRPLAGWLLLRLHHSDTGPPAFLGIHWTNQVNPE